MTSSLGFPDWVPWWAQLLLLILGILVLLAFLLMPFSVFGTKPRLDGIEARLDEIQGEIRRLALRLPEPGAVRVREEGPRAAVAEREPGLRPPIPPASWSPSDGPRRPIGTGTRAEPRLERPGR